MRYVIAGKSDSYWHYIKSHKIKRGIALHARTKKQFDRITEQDTIVLLNGWWARSWAKEFIKEISKVYPTITFEYLDGPFGECERKTLQSDSISSRFDILDL